MKMVAGRFEKIHKISEIRADQESRKLLKLQSQLNELYRRIERSVEKEKDVLNQLNEYKGELLGLMQLRAISSELINTEIAARKQIESELEEIKEKYDSQKKKTSEKIKKKLASEKLLGNSKRVKANNILKSASQLADESFIHKYKS